jgi:gliding motility-associated-like protein
MNTTQTRSSSFFLCLIVLFGVVVSANAQIVGTNAFNQGTYVEVGVNRCGAFGSSTPPAAPGPIGVYHPNPGLPGLGFVADADADGWATGSPQYCGDYFVPGSPVEGWGIQIGSTAATLRINTDQTCLPFQMPGAITTYADGGVTRSTTWEGTYSFPPTSPTITLDITQTTIVPVDKFYFVNRVILCNTGTDTLVDVYYGRNVDPDNEQPWTGTIGFTTFNEIVSQPPIDPEALVTAEGLDLGCFLGLGARDPNARVSYGSFATGSPYQVWNGIGLYSSSGSNTADEAVSIAFKIPFIAPGECHCLAYAYILNASDLAEALDATASTIIFADTTDITISGETRYCVGDSVNLQIIGADDYDWTWTPAFGLNIDTGTSVWASPPTPTLYTATGTNGFCGDLIREALVIPEPAGIADAGLDKTICFGDTVQLDGVAGAGSSSWSPAVNISDALVVDPLVWPAVTTEYIISTESLFGCPGVDTVLVIVNQLPFVNAGNDTTVCIGSEIELSGTGAFNYVWSPVDYLDDATVANPISTPDLDITYSLIGTDANGCVNYDTVSIVVNPLSDVDAGLDVTIDLVKDETALLNAMGVGAVSWLWVPPTGLSDPTIPNPVAQPEETTIYIVTMTDINGCENTDTIEIEVLNEFEIIIPDGFTPNGDGLNDVFHIVIIGLIEVQDISIFNRWGELVFYTTERQGGWDGTYRGIPQEIATYVVVVRIADPKGNPVKVAGTTTIIR